jgi:UDP-N-acetylglucosamine 2-epimerase
MVNLAGCLELLWKRVNSRVVMTDSGGVEGETTIPGISCLTLGNNTGGAFLHFAVGAVGGVKAATVSSEPLLGPVE